jgi:sulfatase modifying factor 1
MVFRFLGEIFFLTLFAIIAAAQPVEATTISWASIGDPGNAADVAGAPNPAGAVPYSFKMSIYEFTNAQYVEFLNSTSAGKNGLYGVYNPAMGDNPRSGITQSGSAGAYVYTSRTNMAGKPVNQVNWFDAARVCNWLQNGASINSDTETGAYPLNGAVSGLVAKSVDAKVWIPSQDEWYKAAYYKGDGLNAGYWQFPTQSNTFSTSYVVDSRGNGQPVAAQNVANYNDFMKWGAIPSDGYGNVTTVGLNGGPSAYGLYDMAGNVQEIVEVTSSVLALRGGSFQSIGGPFLTSHVSRQSQGSYEGLTENYLTGFRIAAVPEPSTWVMGLAAIVCTGWVAGRRRKRTAA